MGKTRSTSGSRQPQEHLDNTWADVFSALASKELNGTQTKGTALDIIIQIQKVSSLLDLDVHHCQDFSVFLFCSLFDLLPEGSAHRCCPVTEWFPKKWGGSLNVRVPGQPWDFKTSSLQAQGRFSNLPLTKPCIVLGLKRLGWRIYFNIRSGECCVHVFLNLVDIKNCEINSLAPAEYVQQLWN